MGCVLERDMARALALYDEARTAHGVRPDAYTLKLLLDACSRAGDARAGLALCAEARAEGVPLDAAARGAMLRACLQEDIPTLALTLTLTLIRTRTRTLTLALALTLTLTLTLT